MKEIDYSNEGVDEYKRAAYKHRLDYFAGLAMQAMMQSDPRAMPVLGVAKLAKEYAIAMLKELDKPNTTS